MESSSPSSFSSSLQYINFPRQPALPPFKLNLSVSLSFREPPPCMKKIIIVAFSSLPSLFLLPTSSLRDAEKSFPIPPQQNAVGRTILKNFGFFPSPCEYICEILVFSHFHVNITFAPLPLPSISKERGRGVGRGSWDLKGQTANDPWLEIQLSISSPHPPLTLTADNLAL